MVAAWSEGKAWRCLGLGARQGQPRDPVKGTQPSPLAKAYPRAQPGLLGDRRPLFGLWSMWSCRHPWARRHSMFIHIQSMFDLKVFLSLSRALYPKVVPWGTIRPTGCSSSMGFGMSLDPKSDSGLHALCTPAWPAGQGSWRCQRWGLAPLC